MEHTLRAKTTALVQGVCEEVLILVVMEHTLRGYFKPLMDSRLSVLILVVMEHTLRETKPSYSKDEVRMS